MSDWDGGDDPLKGLKNSNTGSDFDRMQTNWKLDEVNRNLKDIKFNQDMDRFDRNMNRLRQSGGYTGPQAEMPGLTLFLINFFNILIFGMWGIMDGSLVAWFSLATILFGSVVWYLNKKNATSENPSISEATGTNFNKDIKQIIQLIDNKNIDESKLIEHIQNLIPQMKKSYGTKKLNDYFINIKDPQIWKKDDVNIFELSLKRGKHKTAKVLYHLGIKTIKTGHELVESSSELRYSSDFEEARGVIFGTKESLISSFKKVATSEKKLKNKLHKINDYNSWCVQEKTLHGGMSHPIREKREWIDDPFYQIHSQDLLEGIEPNSEEFKNSLRIINKIKNKTLKDSEFKPEEFTSTTHVKSESEIKIIDSDAKKTEQEKISISKEIWKEVETIISATIDRRGATDSPSAIVIDHINRILILKIKSGVINLINPEIIQVLEDYGVDFIFPLQPIEINFKEHYQLSDSEKEIFFKEIDDKIIKILNSDKEELLKLEKISKNRNETISNEKLKSVEESISSLIGQEKAKSMLFEIISLAKVNKARKENSMNEHIINLHSIFSGSPGTGKTTFARLFAKAIKDLGFLPNGHLVEVSRNDLVAGYVGQTAIKTEEVFKSAIGGVLFIDEAYSLKSGENDQFGSECIDTLVKLMEDNRKDIIVILAGYSSEMRDFLSHNTGLKSRIPNHVVFEDFNDNELLEILSSSFNENGYTLSDDLKALALREILKNKKGGHFGNAREVRNIVERVIKQQSVRISKAGDLTPDNLKSVWASDITECRIDLNKEINPVQKENVSDAMIKLNQLIGLGPVKETINNLKDLIEIEKMRNPENALSDLTLHMAFVGGPGTGKTTVARLIGEIFKEIDILPSGHVVEVDRSSLVGSHIGETAKITTKKLDEALGGVLFIDEAYALTGGENDYGIESINTILKYMEDHRDKLVVIFAGYNNEIESFLSTNPGLKSRVANILDFKDYSQKELRKITELILKEKGLHADNNVLELVVKKCENEKISEDSFSNARSVRNIVEKAKKKQATRLVKLKRSDDLKQEDLARITLEDVA